MAYFKTVLKELSPPLFVRIMRIARPKPTSLYGWFGDYKSWEQAKTASGGYDDIAILKKVKNSLLKVKNGQAVYERDSVLFDKIEYSWPVLAALMWIAVNNHGKLNLIDFGGSLGSTFFQNRFFLETLAQVRWNIVEQEHFVKCGKSCFEDNRLCFYKSIEQCVAEQNPDAILLSSVIQYFEKPYELLRDIVNRNFDYIIVNRTPILLSGNNDRLTIQKVPPHIYEASYPVWFFNREKFLSSFGDKYQLLVEFDALTGKIKIKLPDSIAEDKGFIFVKKGCLGKMATGSNALKSELLRIGVCS
jgi:putative methyltransferase (TIGR04325 family)